MFTYVAFKMLEAAGHRVSPTDIPGLWNVEGIANDVTLNQLRQLAEQHGQPWAPDYRLTVPMDLTICS